MVPLHKRYGSMTIVQVMVSSDGSGRFSVSETGRSLAGTCEFDAYQHKGNRLVLMATLTFNFV